MKIHLFDLKRKDYTVKVFKSCHNSEKRGDSWYERDVFIDEKRYREIIEMSFKWGLTEFKDKGAVAVCFFDDLGYKHTLLMNLNDKEEFYEVFIITSIYSKKFVNKSHFIKCQNRLNIWYWYTMKSMTKEERYKKKYDTLKIKVEKESTTMDKEFRKQMMCDFVTPIH